MQFEARLDRTKRRPSREDHAEVLQRLPATVHAFILVELQKWATLFPAEQRYQRALLEHLSNVAVGELAAASSAGDRKGRSRGGADPHRRAAIPHGSRISPRRRCGSRVSSRPGGGKSICSSSGRSRDSSRGSIRPTRHAARPAAVRQRHRGAARQALEPAQSGEALRIPLTLDGGEEPRWLPARALWHADRQRSRASLFGRLQDDAAFAATDAWIVESHRRCTTSCCRRRAPAMLPRAANREPRTATASLTGLSYERLLPYRDELMRALFSRIQSGVESPQAFAAYARSLTIAPEPGALLQSGCHRPGVRARRPADRQRHAVRQQHVRRVGGRAGAPAGAAAPARRALRRARQAEAVQQPPALLAAEDLGPDPAHRGSASDPSSTSSSCPTTSGCRPRRAPPIERKTLYLFLAESQDELLAIRSDTSGPPASPPAAVSLSDVCATMAQWLGVPPPEGSGRPIAPLVA